MRDWQIEAMVRTLAISCRTPGFPMEGDMGYLHLADMVRRVAEDGTMSRAKIGRWLGWMQCAVVASGAATLEDMKQINRACSAEAESE